MKTKGAITRTIIMRRRSNGEVVAEFRGSMAAARATGITNATILNHCHGRTTNPTVWALVGKKMRRVIFEFANETQHPAAL